MKLRKEIIFFAVFCLFFSACAKKKLDIGRENPEKEIQKCMKLSEKKLFQEAVECMEVFKSHFPKSQWGIEAEIHIGDNYFRQKEYLLAADSYQSFTKLHPAHQKTDYAYYKSGLSYLKETPKAIDRDQEYLDDAIANFEIVIRGFPDTPYLNLAQTYLTEAKAKLAKRSFYIGRFYYKTGEYLAAIPRFQEVADNYRDTGLADRALYFATLANIKLDRLEEAKATFSKMSLEHPNSKYIPVLEKKLIKAVKKS